jgi:hypothetical protein
MRAAETGLTLTQRTMRTAGGFSRPRRDPSARNVRQPAAQERCIRSRGPEGEGADESARDRPRLRRPAARHTSEAKQGRLRAMSGRPVGRRHRRTAPEGPFSRRNRNEPPGNRPAPASDRSTWSTRPRLGAGTLHGAAIRGATRSRGSAHTRARGASSIPARCGLPASQP